jgi:hypothetical protein
MQINKQDPKILYQTKHGIVMFFFFENQTKHEKHNKLTRSQNLCHNHNYKSKQRKGKQKADNKETFKEKGYLK